MYAVLLQSWKSSVHLCVTMREIFYPCALICSSVLTLLLPFHLMLCGLGEEEKFQE